MKLCTVDDSNTMPETQRAQFLDGLIMMMIKEMKCNEEEAKKLRESMEIYKNYKLPELIQCEQ